MLKAEQNRLAGADHAALLLCLAVWAVGSPLGWTFLISCISSLVSSILGYLAVLY